MKQSPHLPVAALNHDLCHVLFAVAEVQTWEYAIACITNTNVFHGCNIRVYSNATANVTINTYDTTTNIQLEAREQHVWRVDESLLPVLGVERKGILITSDSEIQVIVEKLHVENNYAIDAFQSHTKSNSSQQQYYTISVPNIVSCSLYNHYLSVVAYEDDTHVTLTYQDGTDISYQLNTFRELTLKTSDHLNDFVSGTHINASKPVTVSSGNLCVGATPDGEPNGGASVVSDIPSTEQYGTQFVAPPLGSPGYMVNIIATEDNTVVSHDDQDMEINAGDIYRIERPYHDDIFSATCSKPCFLSQFTYGVADETGNFLLNVLPIHQFYRSCVFVTMDYEITHYISIVAVGIPPMDDIYVDGENLQDLVWQTAEGISFATIDISNGFHDMYSTATEFAVYVYGHTSYYGGGYGYSVIGWSGM